MGVLDAAFHLGVEGSYGAGATPTRSFEAKVDDWKRAQAQIESNGMRADNQATRSDRRRQINMGGAGKLNVDFLTGGMGLLLQGLLGSVSGPTQVAATTAYEQTFESTDMLPSTSYAAQIERQYADDSGQEEFTHVGCKATQWRLRQQAGQALGLEVDFDFQDVGTATAAATAAYPASTEIFDWTMCGVSIDGGSFEEVRAMDFAANLQAKTDRRYLRSSALKKAPVGAGLPVYTATIDSDFVKTEFYDDFVAGNIVPVVFTWTHDADGIESGQAHTITLTLAACQFDGDSPMQQVGGVAQQRIPLKVLYNGTDPAVSLVVKSADTAL